MKRVRQYIGILAAAAEIICCAKSKLLRAVVYYITIGDLWKLL